MNRVRSYVSVLITSFLLLIVVSSSVQAEIYQWKDEAGFVHFSDTPPADVKKEDVEIKSYVTPEVTTNSSYIAADKKVVMYGTSWCGVCKKAKVYFKSNGIPFKEYDIEKSSKGRRDYRKIGGRGVPVILVGSIRLNGFNEKSFEAIYAEQRSGVE